MPIVGPDIFMLFGDSITQGAWEPNLDGFGQRLSRKYDYLLACCRPQRTMQQISIQEV